MDSLPPDASTAANAAAANTRKGLCNFPKCDNKVWIGVKGKPTAKCPGHTYSLFLTNISTGLKQTQRLYPETAGAEEHVGNLQQIIGQIECMIYTVLSGATSQAKTALDNATAAASDAAALAEVARNNLKAATANFNSANAKLLDHKRRAAKLGVELHAGSDDVYDMAPTASDDHDSHGEVATVTHTAKKPRVDAADL